MNDATELGNVGLSSGSRYHYDDYALRSYEIYWRDHQEWLAERGYMLRPRYKPDWVPSWKDTNENPAIFEDGMPMQVRTNLQ